MPTAERISVIQQIEAARESRVLTYITGDRRGFETKIASDVFPFILEHLVKFGRPDHIDLFLYTPGGLTNAASGLVSLIREFTDNFSVIIPFKAHSAGTLIALGADSIVMTYVSQLSPVDPSITSPYNPTIPNPQPGGASQQLPVSVEDVIGFLDLAKQEAGLNNETSLTAVFQELSEKIHPLALGNVYRAREQIKMIARRLLMGRTRHVLDDKGVDDIVNTLTHELYSHDYIIGRKEAIDTLKLPVEPPNQKWDRRIWDLYQQYEKLLEMTVPYNQDVLLGERQVMQHTFTRGIIESSDSTHAFQTTREIRRVQVSQPKIPQPIVGFQERTIMEGWSSDVDI